MDPIAQVPSDLSVENSKKLPKKKLVIIFGVISILLLLVLIIVFLLPNFLRSSSNTVDSPPVKTLREIKFEEFNDNYKYNLRDDGTYEGIVYFDPSNYTFEFTGKLVNVENNTLELEYQKTVKNINMIYNSETLVKSTFNYNNNNGVIDSELPADLKIEDLSGSMVNVTTVLNEDGQLIAQVINLKTIEKLSDILPPRFDSFPDEYKSRIRFINKELGDVFDESGIFYFKGEDKSDGLVLYGEVVDWGQTTVRLKFDDGATVDLLIPSTGLLEYLGEGKTAIVSEERKTYYINRTVSVELELIDSTFIAKSFVLVVD